MLIYEFTELGDDCAAVSAGRLETGRRVHGGQAGSN